MSEQINRETGCRYARLDGSIVNGDPTPREYRHQPNWQGAWIYCLRVNDEESAHLIRIRNDERYAERCERDVASVFPAESPALKSLREVESERTEQEAA